MTKSGVLADTRAVSAVEMSSTLRWAHSDGDVVILTGILHRKGMAAAKPYLRYRRYVDTWVPKADRRVCTFVDDHSPSVGKHDGKGR